MINIKWFIIKIKDIRLFIITIFMGILSFIAGTANNNIIAFIMSCIILVIIIYKANFSYFTFFSFILWFSFLQEYLASIDKLLASGLLKWNKNMPVYFKELYYCTIFFFLFELLIFSISNVLENEKALYKIKIDMSIRMSIIYSLGAFFFVVLSYPTLPSFSAALSRNEGIVQSALFVPIAMLVLATTFSNLRKSRILDVIWSLTLIWVLFHGERVIVFGLLVYIALKYINNENSDFKNIKSIIFNKKVFIIILAGIGVVFLGLRIQVTRVGRIYVRSISSLISSIVSQGTAGDVVYVFNCATNMWKTGEAMGGSTYWQYITCWIPFMNNEYSPAKILMDKYFSLGGGLFFAEPIMNNGLIGVYIYSAVFILLLVFIFNRASQYRAYFIIPFIILIFRFAWYASLAGWVTLSVYVVPVLYFVVKKFK